MARNGETEEGAARATRSTLHVARPAAGGMVSHLKLLLPRLASAGVRVGLVWPAGTEPPRFAETAGVDESIAIATYAAPILGRPHPVMDARAARRVAEVCVAAPGFDLLHGHGLRGAWISALAARLSGRRFVFTAHNLAPASAGILTRFALRYVLRRSAAVICVSTAVLEGLARFGLRRSAAFVIPNGIDMTPFYDAGSGEGVRRELDIPATASLVVAIGRLSREKGFDTLISAADILSRGNRETAQFALAGDGPERDGFRRRVAALADPERFRLLGRFEDVPGLLAAADLVVVPSREEGQGIVALEAMAARRPVIATRVGGLVETIIDGTTGLLVAPDEPASLSAAIASLLEDRETRTRMGESGRRRVEEEFTADLMADRTAQLYRELPLSG